MTGPKVKSTNRLWDYHPECYRLILDRPLSWYEERTKYTYQWDYLFPNINPHRKLLKWNG